MGAFIPTSLSRQTKLNAISLFYPSENVLPMLLEYQTHITSKTFILKCIYVLGVLQGTLCLLLIAGSIASSYGDGFHHGPVSFGPGDQDHPGGGKSFTTFTLGGNSGNTVSVQSAPKVTTLGGMKSTALFHL